jgi:hypothetical protein
MLKPVVMLAATGAAALLALKLLGFLLLPLFGWFLGLVMWVVKAAVIAGLLWWAFHLFKRWNEKGSEA